MSETKCSMNTPGGVPSASSLPSPFANIILEMHTLRTTVMRQKAGAGQLDCQTFELPHNSYSSHTALSCMCAPLGCTQLTPCSRRLAARPRAPAHRPPRRDLPLLRSASTGHAAPAAAPRLHRRPYAHVAHGQACCCPLRALLLQQQEPKLILPATAASHAALTVPETRLLRC